MKTQNIIAISLIALGLIIVLTGGFSTSEGGGFAVILLGFPLILTGIFLFFSLIGSCLIFAAMILLLLLEITHISSSIGIWAVYLILIVGIIYGIVEGILKLTKKNKKNKK